VPADEPVTLQPAAAAPAASGSVTGTAVAVVLGGLGAVALVLLLFAVIPAERAPWYWAEQVLAARRQQFAVSGLMCMVAEGVVFALVFLGG
jgi:hypothetical protein